MRKFIALIFLFYSALAFSYFAPVETGAEQMHLYLPLLHGKNVAVFANQTSLVKDQHLIDFLLSHHIDVKKIFAPEHGYRGDVDAHLSNTVDAKTNIPVIALFGTKFKPSKADLSDINVLVFDVQDVGVRFYTYISSLQKLMEAAAEHHIPLIILDRPNPNGFYVDGPVLDPKYKSFTGMQPIPIVYGMTIGEYAKMLVGERWFKGAEQLKLVVIPARNYTHNTLYEPPVKPSPNLPDIQSIYWYPTLGLLEGTTLSVGRGTVLPFQVFGHPALKGQPYHFKPKAMPWERYPKYYGQLCYGWSLAADRQKTLLAIDRHIQIKYLLKAYQAFPKDKKFFSGFSYSAGNNELEQQIKLGMSEQEIRDSWEPQLSAFKKIRKKYLMYPDFKTRGEHHP